MSNFKIGGVNFVFSTNANFEARIVKVNFDKEVKEIVFPDTVQVDGRNYVVTEIVGDYELSEKTELVTDKRKKNYGYLEGTGEYDRRWHSVAGMEGKKEYCMMKVVKEDGWKNVKKIKLNI